MKPASRRSLVALLAGWAAFSVASLWLRPLWPVDETRYAAVAWEMWLRGDFLVPWVNGEPYSHKPPLLFWLMHLGWGVFGVNEWWPRLVAPLCALGAVPLLLRLEKLLWKEEQTINSPWLLFGTLLFAGFITLTMFDLLLMLCAMAGMIGVLNLSHKKRIPGLLWLGAGIGLGVLAKGPVILLHVLPAAVVAPWWAPQLKGRVARWYLELLLGVLIGAAIALAWALPAAWSGGEAYQRAIFWGQTAGRAAESFAHRAPLWYYLPLLPLILFPWFVWPAFWRGVRNSWHEGPDKFLLAWLLLTLIGFSLVSGKQAKYLVPMLPAFALLAGRALARVQGPPRSWEMGLPLAGFLALPAGLAWIRAQPAALSLPQWSSDMPLWPIIVLAAAAPALMLFSKKEISIQVRALGFAVLAAFALLLAGVIPAFAPYADTMPAAQYLAAQQRLKVPLAHLGKYHAQYNFSGRLSAPIAILEARELPAWVAAHPAGQVISVERRPHEAKGAAAPEYQGPFRGAWVQVWRGERLLQARPELR